MYTGARDRVYGMEIVHRARGTGGFVVRKGSSPIFGGESFEDVERFDNFVLEHFVF